MEDLLFSKAYKNIDPDNIDILFILGHHRSGTTFAHRLLASPQNHASMRQFDCIFPEINILGNNSLRPLLNFLLRVFSVYSELHKVEISMDFPGEEDIALLLQFNPSAYNWAHVFPHNAGVIAQKTIEDMKLDSEIFEHFRQDYLTIVQKLAYLFRGKKLILKSPPNVARPHLLKKMFPKAKFLFLMRDPYTLYPSMKGFWKLHHRVSLQKFKDSEMDHTIFSQGNILLNQYFQNRDAIAPEQIFECRYESIKSRPMEFLQKLYGRIGWTMSDLESRDYENFIQADQSQSETLETKNPSDKQRALVNKHWSDLVDYYQNLSDF